MQNGTVVQNQVPSAELVRISRQSATERPHDDDWAVKSVSLESDRIKAADAQTYRDGDIGERNSESEPMASGIHPLEQTVDTSRRRSLAHIVNVNERRYVTFSEARSANNIRRFEVHHRLDNVQYIMGRFQKSIGALTAGITDKKNGKKPNVRRKRLEGRLRTDAEELTGHIASTVMLISQLRESDRHVNETGDALHNSLQAMSTALRRNYLLQADDDDDDDDMHSSVSLVPTPASRSDNSDAALSSLAVELANFCDAVATFKIMRERIGELIFEKEEQEERRDFLVDQELRLEERSEYFLRTWHSRLENAEKEYRGAEEAVERARKVCEDANVSIPTWAETNSAFSEIYQPYNNAAQLATASPPESIILQQSSRRRVGSSAGSSEPVVIDASAPMFSSLDNPPSSNEKITRWMEDVSSSVTHPSSILSSMPVCNADTSIIDAHSSEDQRVETIRRIRSFSYPPTATRLRLIRRSPASCPPKLESPVKISGQSLPDVTNPEMSGVYKRLDD